jgi:phage shock protein A
MGQLFAIGTLTGLALYEAIRLMTEGDTKLLDLAIEDMQEELFKLRQTVTLVMVTQKHTQQQYEQTQSEVSKWKRRAQLAVQNDLDDLVREAIRQKKTFTEKANTLKANIDEQTALVDVLNSKLAAFEIKVSEAKVFKAQIKTQIIAAKTQERLQYMGCNMNDSAMEALRKNLDEL